MTTKMDAVGDAQRRLPIEVQRAVWKVEAVAEGGMANDYPTRCQQQAQRECARDALALAIEAHVASATSAVGYADAALDEARERIEALERQARIATETLERQRVEIAYLRRQLKESEPLMFDRAERLIERLREKSRDAASGRLVLVNGECRWLGQYEVQTWLARWSRAADRCRAIVRGEPAFGGV